MCHKLFHKIEREKTLANSFHKASINLISNELRTRQKRKIETNFLEEHSKKIFNKILGN
jgi:hypothetical protein